MNADQRTKQILRIEQARQMQEIVAKYPVFSDSMNWVAAKIKSIDDTWYKQALDEDVLQQLRGQRQVLTDVKAHFDSMLNMDLIAESKKLEDVSEDDS